MEETTKKLIGSPIQVTHLFKNSMTNLKDRELCGMKNVVFQKEIAYKSKLKLSNEIPRHAIDESDYFTKRCFYKNWTEIDMEMVGTQSAAERLRELAFNRACTLRQRVLYGKETGALKMCEFFHCLIKK